MTQASSRRHEKLSGRQARDFAASGVAAAGAIDALAIALAGLSIALPELASALFIRTVQAAIAILVSAAGFA